MPKKRVVLTGVGLVTPVGNNLPDFWDAIINCKCGADKLKAFDCSNFVCQIAAEVKNFDASLYMN
ncbi:MAG: beta-ketoacyl-[acyl-carrier-protein] synthase II, partial [Candidatus Omnitrophica bacterium]|nr:beta-ketoacyl-[acyl-carrier-protein] synthase II [Candidatus Omnitrophota bacterium]